MASDSARNPLERNSRIDLHGLRPREAFVRAERALVKAIKEGRETLYLIVGQGRHSINGKPVLKKTVQIEIIRFGFLHFLHILFLLMVKLLQKWI
jgi:dsDNA-specific endonuclease/ATPase MutS2